MSRDSKRSAGGRLPRSSSSRGSTAITRAPLPRRFAMAPSRRQFFAAAAAAPVAGLVPAAARAADPPAKRKQHIGVSTYSYLKLGRKTVDDVVNCVDLAAEQG